jgi:vancomycin permeability regulator SanA
MFMEKIFMKIFVLQGVIEYEGRDEIYVGPNEVLAKDVTLAMSTSKSEDIKYYLDEENENYDRFVLTVWIDGNCIESYRKKLPSDVWEKF